MKWPIVIALCLFGLSLRVAGEIAESPEAVQPLQPGQAVPAVTVRDVSGAPVELQSRIAGRRAVVIFYRGGWCPYCTRHLAGLREIMPALRDLGYDLVAICPDPVDKLGETRVKQQIEFTLLSDNDFAAAEAFGLAYRVDEETARHYGQYNVPLYSPRGSTSKVLPVPAVFVVGDDSIIRFSHANPDYKVRLDPSEILKAASKEASELAEAPAP